MIVRSHGSNVALRALTPQSNPSWVIPSPGAGGSTASGLSPTWQDAYGLPAMLFCLLLVFLARNLKHSPAGLACLAFFAVLSATHKRP